MRIVLLPIAAVAFAVGCSAPAPENAVGQPSSEPPVALPSRAETMPSAAPTPAPLPKPQAAQPTLASTMPDALRGQWRVHDLGRAPTADDCKSASSGFALGKVLNVQANRYTVFEEGGRIIEVHRRTDSMIDATFDTTYADTPTRERKTFKLQPDGMLAVNTNDDREGSAIRYGRCAGSGR